MGAGGLRGGRVLGGGKEGVEGGMGGGEWHILSRDANPPAQQSVATISKSVV